MTIDGCVEYYEKGAGVLACLVMELAVHSFSVGIHQFVGVAAVSIHVAISIGSSTVGKQKRNVVSCLRAKRHEIPKHIGILQGNATLQ